MSGETFAFLKKELGTGRTVDLVLVVAFYCGVVRLLETLEVDVEPTISPGSTPSRSTERAAARPVSGFQSVSRPPQGRPQGFRDAGPAAPAARCRSCCRA